MAVSRGKQFEQVVREAFSKVPNVSIDRLHDQTTHYKGSTNICDYIVYKEPYEYYVECKSCHGKSLPFSNITDNQWKGLLEKSKIQGVHAGILCWFIDEDVTVWWPINMLNDLRELGDKSININGDWCQFYGHDWNWHWVLGTKKRVFFDYDMQQLLTDIEFYAKEL